MSTLMPAKIRNLVFYSDGLRYSCSTAALAIKRLSDTLDLLVDKRQRFEGIQEEEVASLLDAWVIVDMCHRAREIIQQVPGLSPKSPEIQIFLRATSEIEELRNHVQHFRSGIHKIPNETYPLWGSISWTLHQEINSSAKKCEVLVFGNLLPGVSAPSCSMDTQSDQFEPQIMLFAGNACVNLIAIEDHLKRLKKFWKDWLGKHPQLRLVGGQPLSFAVVVHKNSAAK